MNTVHPLLNQSACGRYGSNPVRKRLADWQIHCTSPPFKHGLPQSGKGNPKTIKGLMHVRLFFFPGIKPAISQPSLVRQLLHPIVEEGGDEYSKGSGRPEWCADGHRW